MNSEKVMWTAVFDYIKCPHITFVTWECSGGVFLSDEIVIYVETNLNFWCFSENFDFSVM